MIIVLLSGVLVTSMVLILVLLSLLRKSDANVTAYRDLVETSQAHVEWSDSQHKITLESLHGQVLDLLTSINDEPTLKGSQIEILVLGLDELIKARKEWVASHVNSRGE